jgi:hypothetical protein
MSDELARLVEAEKARDAERARKVDAERRALEERAASRQRISSKWEIDVQTAVPEVIEALNQELTAVNVELGLVHNKTDGPILATGMIHIAKNEKQVGELSFDVHENGDMVMRCVIRRGRQLAINIDGVDDKSTLNILGATDESSKVIVVRELERFLPQLH